MESAEASSIFGIRGLKRDQILQDLGKGKFKNDRRSSLTVEVGSRPSSRMASEARIFNKDFGWAEMSLSLDEDIVQNAVELKMDKLKAGNYSILEKIYENKKLLPALKVSWSYVLNLIETNRETVNFSGFQSLEIMQQGFLRSCIFSRNNISEIGRGLMAIGMKARIDSENEIRMRYRKFLWKNFVQVQIGTIVNSMMSDYISAQRVKMPYLLYDRYK